MPSWTRSRVSLLVSAASLAWLNACSDEHKAQQAAASPVTVVELTASDQPVSQEFVAQTQSSRQVEIRTRVAGFLDKRVYQEGQMVKEGDTLFILDKKPFEAQLLSAKAQLAQQQARLTTAQANLNRVKPLVEQNALSRKDLDDSTGQAQAAAAAVEAAKASVTQAELNLSYCTIKSPVKGLTSFAKVQDGTYLTTTGENALLTYVAALDPMRVVFSISENQMLRYRKDLEDGLIIAPKNENYVVKIILSDGSVYPHPGHITFSDVDFGQQTGTTQIRAEVKNPDGALRPGQFVRVQLSGSIRPKALKVPQVAVQQGDKGHYVWIVDKESKAQIRNVQVGSWTGSDWFIDKGLQSGDKVIVDGLLKLAPGVPVKAEIASPAAPPASPPASPKTAPQAAPTPAQPS